MADRVKYRRQMHSTVAGLERRIATLERERNEAFAARDRAEKAVRDMTLDHARRLAELRFGLAAAVVGETPALAQTQSRR